MQTLPQEKENEEEESLSAVEKGHVQHSDSFIAPHHVKHSSIIDDDDPMLSIDALKAREYDEKLLELRKTFAMFDKDSDGTIGRSELEACLIASGLHPTAAEMDQLYKMMDTDGNGVISFEEFIRVMVDEFEMEEMEEELKEIRELFAMVDKDGSGRLTSDELKRAITAMGLRVEMDVCQHLYSKMARQNPSAGVSFDEFATFLLQYNT